MFINLSTKTIFSIMDSTIRKENLIEHALEKENKYVAIANHNNMFEIFDFEKACLKKELEPILGVDLTLKHYDEENYSNIKLYAKNANGYKTLVRLATEANVGDKKFPYITYEQLADATDVVCLTGGDEGELFYRFANGKEVTNLLNKLISIFGKEDLFIELTNHLIPAEETLLNSQEFYDLIQEKGLEVVFTNNAHYMDPAHSYHRALALEMNANPEGSEFRDRYTNYNSEFYLKDEDEMRHRFRKWLSKYPKGLENSVKICEKCSGVRVPIQRELPSFPIPGGESTESYLRKLAWRGFAEKYKINYHENEEILQLTSLESDKIKKLYRFPEGHDFDEYVNRLNYEIEVVAKMGFLEYFLIVSDYTQWCKDVDVYKHPERYFPKEFYDHSKIPDFIVNKDYEIYVGPGRGSAAGSLLAFCLKITETIDPIQYDLLFERFLNIERVSMPDVDMDFSNKDREKVVQFCQYKYGWEKVAQIVTFQTLGPKSLIKAVGKVLGMPYAETDALTKEVPKEYINANGEAKALETLEQLKTIEYFKKQIEDNEQVAQLFDFGSILDGIPSSTGKHAAGVIIGKVPLQEVVALMEVDGVLVTQFEKMNCEDIGLLKMDFLGLKTEDLIQDTIESIYNRQGVKVDIDNIALDDAKTFELLRKALTTNVFQFEGNGMKNLLRQLQPTRFEQLAAVTSLFRPGPMEFIPNYISGERNKGSVHYPHAIFKEVTENTNGILIYQEQIMSLVQKMAGFSLGEADLLRRGIGKKIEKYLIDGRLQFIEGSKNLHGIDEKISDEIYETIIKFANYGFNKSHAVAYALISYQTAYLKAHYPVEFMCASLNLNALDAEKLASTIAETFKMGIQILPPKLGKSKFEFSIENGKIRYGYKAVKNVGEALAKPLEDISEDSSFQKVIESIPANVIRSNQLENLTYAGTFDKYGNRRSIASAIPAYIELVKMKDSFLKLGIKSFFDDFKEAEPTTLAEYPELQKLQKERNVIQCTLSNHPLKGLRNTVAPEINDINTTSVKETRENIDGTLMTMDKVSVKMLVMIDSLRKITTKKGDMMASLMLSDEYGELDAVVFPREYTKLSKQVNDCIGLPCVVTGSVSVRVVDDTLQYQIIVNAIDSVAETKSRLFISNDDFDDNLLNTLNSFNGNTEVVVIDKAGSYQRLNIQTDLNDVVYSALKNRTFKVIK